MAELCSFSWKFIFSLTDFVQIFRAYVKKYYLVSQEKKFVLLFTKNC